MKNVFIGYYSRSGNLKEQVLDTDDGPRACQEYGKSLGNKFA
jgi:hypothetical protein